MDADNGDYKAELQEQLLELDDLMDEKTEVVRHRKSDQRRKRGRPNYGILPPEELDNVVASEVRRQIEDVSRKMLNTPDGPYRDALKEQLQQLEAAMERKVEELELQNQLELLGSTKDEMPQELQSLEGLSQDELVQNPSSDAISPEEKVARFNKQIDQLEKELKSTPKGSKNDASRTRLKKEINGVHKLIDSIILSMASESEDLKNTDNHGIQPIETTEQAVAVDIEEQASTAKLNSRTDQKPSMPRTKAPPTEPDPDSVGQGQTPVGSGVCRHLRGESDSECEDNYDDLKERDLQSLNNELKELQKLLMAMPRDEKSSKKGKTIKARIIAMEDEIDSQSQSIRQKSAFGLQKRREQYEFEDTCIGKTPDLAAILRQKAEVRPTKEILSRKESRLRRNNKVDDCLIDFSQAGFEVVKEEANKWMESEDATTITKEVASGPYP